MTRGRWASGLLWTSSITAGATGLAYAFFRYLMEPADPFSAFGHPLQPWALAAHILIAPLSLFAIGWFWGEHALTRYRTGRGGRRSGLGVIALAALMAFSGYALQVASASASRELIAWLHGISGTIFLGALGGHVYARWRAHRRTRGARTSRTSRAESVARVSNEV